jgi:hypothetical protein
MKDTAAKFFSKSGAFLLIWERIEEGINYLESQYTGFAFVPSTVADLLLILANLLSCFSGLM